MFKKVKFMERKVIFFTQIKIKNKIPHQEIMEFHDNFRMSNILHIIFIYKNLSFDLLLQASQISLHLGFPV